MRSKENQANKKMEVIITGYHVFGADIKKGYVRVNSRRRPGRDCRGPEAMDGVELSNPCGLDSLTRSNGSGNPCRNDGVDLLSTTIANIALNKVLRLCLD
jgi:hypothetical protein